MTTWTDRGLAFALTLLCATTALAEDAPDPAQAFQSQDWAAAEMGYSQLVEKEPENGLAWYRLGYARHALGKYESALEAHAKAAELPHAGKTTAAYNAACATSLLGRVDDSLTWLNQAVAGGFWNGNLLESDADLARLREDERFWPVRNALVAKVRYRSLIPAGPGDARQFDFWLGEWDAVSHAADGKGSWRTTGQLQSRVFAAAGGNAIVEYSESPAGKGSMLGFSVRTYDPRAREWVSILNWPSPEKPLFYALTGRVHHGRAELVTLLSKAQGGGATQTRFSFSDIAPDSYRWDSAVTSDAGNTWNTNLVFEARRRAADAPALRVGPSRSNARATGEVFRGLDALLGDWTGTRRVRRGDGWEELPVTLRAESILEGAAMAETSLVGPANDRSETYAIRAYEPQRSAWVQYDVDDRAPGFRRREGAAPKDGTLQLDGAAGPGSSGAPGALIWTFGADASVRCVHRVGDRVIWEQTLSRKP